MMWHLLAHGSASGDPHGLLVVWPLWEHLSHRMWPLLPIPGAPYGMLKLRFTHHRGARIVLADGTEIRRGALVGELHCDNLAILNGVRAGLNPYRAARNDLRALAAWLAAADPDREVAALFGVTLLGIAAARLGFCVQSEHGGIRARLDRWFMTGLLVIYTTDGLHHLDHGSTIGSGPQEVWLSRSELFRRYRRPGPSEIAAAGYQIGSRAPAATIAPLATPISASPATSPAANSTPPPCPASSPPTIVRASAPSRIVTLKPNGR
jgi:hypothetical protein